MLIVKANCFSDKYLFHCGSAQLQQSTESAAAWNLMRLVLTFWTVHTGPFTKEKYTIGESLRKNPVYSSSSTNMDVPELLHVKVSPGNTDLFSSSYLQFSCPFLLVKIIYQLYNSNQVKAILF